jgi:hypothetical protein
MLRASYVENCDCHPPILFRSYVTTNILNQLQQIVLPLQTEAIVVGILSVLEVGHDLVDRLDFPFVPVSFELVDCMRFIRRVHDEQLGRVQV